MSLRPRGLSSAHHTPQLQASTPLPSKRQSPLMQHQTAPSSMQDTPKLSSSPRPPGEYRVFCHDLVVPEGSECCLTVPILSAPGPMQLSDRFGNKILQAMPRSGVGPERAGIILPWMELISISGDVLAQCAAIRKGPNAMFELFRPHFEPFGNLTAVPGKDANRGYVSTDTSWPDNFKLETVVGQTYQIFGNLAERRVHFTEPTGTLIAVTERINPESYLLRVASLTDVGLILCSLLCVEHLNGPIP